MPALSWFVALQDERLGRIVDIILEDPGAGYTVESLAETAAMSRSAFAEHFAKSFGRSPMSFINHVRMQRAAQMLTVENLSVDEIVPAATQAAAIFHGLRITPVFHLMLSAPKVSQCKQPE